jgi:hypothetical protein
MLSNAETKDLIRRFETTMNERRLDDLDDLLAPDVVRHCEATPGFVIENIDQFKTSCVRTRRCSRTTSRRSNTWITWDNMAILGQLGHLPG